MSVNEWNGMLIGVVVIAASIICGIAVVFASMRSSQITEKEEKKDE